MRHSYEIQGGRLVPSEHGSIHVVLAPDEKEREELRNTLGILDYDIDAALDPDEISRVEFDQRGTSIIWNHPYRDSTCSSTFTVNSVGLFLRNGTLTIITQNDIATFTEPDFHEVSGIHSFLIRYFFYTTRQYLNHLKAIKQTTTQLESMLTSSTAGNSAFLRIFELSESLVYYLNAIEANGAVLSKLRDHLDHFGLTPRQLARFDDAILENKQCARQAKIYSDLLSGLMDARGNIINNNMNILLRNLTIINVIFMPLNLFAGIGGMSEYSRMIDAFGLNWEAGYVLFMAALAMVAWLTWRLLWRYMGIGK